MTNESGLEFEQLTKTAQNVTCEKVSNTDERQAALDDCSTWAEDGDVLSLTEAVVAHWPTIRAALQSPRVEVIEGLDEAIDLFRGIDEAAARYGDAAKEDVATQALLKIHKAARAYAKLMNTKEELKSPTNFSSHPKMQKVDLDGMKLDLSVHEDWGRVNLDDPDYCRDAGYNKAIDDIKSKYGELYAMNWKQK
jgi:hypothetical protein